MVLEYDDFYVWFFKSKGKQDCSDLNYRKVAHRSEIYF